MRNILTLWDLAEERDNYRMAESRINAKKKKFVPFHASVEIDSDAVAVLLLTHTIFSIDATFPSAGIPPCCIVPPTPSDRLFVSFMKMNGFTTLRENLRQPPRGAHATLRDYVRLTFLPFPSRASLIFSAGSSSSTDFFSLPFCRGLPRRRRREPIPHCCTFSPFFCRHRVLHPGNKYEFPRVSLAWHDRIPRTTRLNPRSSLIWR